MNWTLPSLVPLCPLSCMMTVLETAAIKILKGESKREHRTCIMVMRYAKKFTFLHGIGKDRLRNVRDSYLTNGLETRLHGNTKRLPHNHLTHAVITNVMEFLNNYAEENAILLPGRIPRHKRDDIKLLPSSRSKKVPPK